MKNALLIGLLSATTAFSSFAQNAVSSQSVLSTSRTMLSELKHPDPQHHFDFTLKTFLLPNRTWGYDVFADGALLFHQVEMPGKQAGTGFATKEDASKVATYIIQLLKAPVVPPVATIEDMKNMNIR